MALFAIRRLMAGEGANPGGGAPAPAAAANGAVSKATAKPSTGKMDIDHLVEPDGSETAHDGNETKTAGGKIPRGQRPKLVAHDGGSDGSPSPAGGADPIAGSGEDDPFANPFTADRATPEPAAGDPLADLGLTGEARAKVQAIAERAARAEQGIAQFQQAWQQATQQTQVAMQRLEQQSRQAAERAARAEASLQTMQRYIAEQRQAAAGPEDPAAAYEKQILTNAERRARAALMPEVQKLQRRLDQAEQANKQREQQAQRQARSTEISTKVDAIVDQHFIAGIDPEVAKGLRTRIGNHIIAEGINRGISLDQAAREFYDLFASWARAKTQSKRAGGEQIRRSQAGSPAPRQSRSATQTGTKTMTEAQARKAGFRDSLDAAIAQDGIIGAR